MVKEAFILFNLPVKIMKLEKYKKIIGDDFAKDADFMDKRIKKFGLDKNSKILDIGTGLGAMSILLALNGFTVLTGQPAQDHKSEEHTHHGEPHEHHEFSTDWREKARIMGVEDKIQFQYVMAESLNFPDSTFDGIFMYDTLQHIKKREKALTECIRVLKSGGLICVIEWNEKSIKDTKEKYGFTIDYIDPRKILTREDISIELFSGDVVNMFVIRK